MAQVTRLGLHGGPRGLYGSFAGRSENVVTAEAVTTGGGTSKRKRRGRYPRWVQVDGNRHLVHSAEEERQLLTAFLDRAKDALKAAPPAEKQKARVRVQKLETRVEAVQSREESWLDRLKAEDDELILLL